MAFIFRQRSELFADEAARLEAARQATRRLDEAIVGLMGRDGDSGTNAIVRKRVARLTHVAIDCRAEIDDAQWRFLKGDSLGAERHITQAVATAEEAVRSIDLPATSHVSVS